MYLCTHMYDINIMSIYIYIYPKAYYISFCPIDPFPYMHIIYIGRGRGERERGREDIIMIGLYDAVRPRLSELFGTH